MSLIDISPYKFRKLAGQKEWVHVVCKFKRTQLRKLLTNSGFLCYQKKMYFIHLGPLTRHLQRYIQREPSQPWPSIC